LSPQPADIAAALSPERVLILPGFPSKALVISALADSATASLSAHDRVAFIRAALEREDVAPTAIGWGIAIPHARGPAVDHCRIAIGILPSGVRWGASDGQDVHLALFIAARESDHSEHLRLMAALAARLRRPGLAQRMRTMTDHATIVAAILGA
jgi:mannitol/fructose-specific phosphotransferase system IIA component (Ntr-type)